MPSPFDNLKSANEDYHTAVNEIFEDNVLSVEVKAKFGAFHNNIFQLMKQAQDENRRDKMTINEANQNLDGAISMMRLTRNEHIALQQSLQTLITAAKDNQEKKKEEKKDGGTDQAV